ncbi:MAG: beta-galactosidase [Firmicutes bacterium]|nr:beta-galactosidase [Bacillota bacterium]
MNTFTHDEKNFLMNGKPYTVISGAMHYFRIPREYWYDRLLKLKECGFNTVETYVCWNLHEKTEGEFDFSGGLDIGEYADTAASLGLNLILRPGPYICAEWDLGGLPAWLLTYENMPFRCNDKLFLEKCERFLTELFKHITPRLITHGGNIIMVQIENEYGSYGDDKEYLNAIVDIYKKCGVDCQLYTADGTDKFMLGGGPLPGYLSVSNFGSNPAGNFKNMDEFRPGQPKMCGEYWCGWFDHWYDIHHVRSSNEIADVFKEMLEMGASVNFYMFHGGTNFGFMNGANCFGDNYEPTVTSYDYNAPLTEAGDFTPAYYAIRDVVADFLKEPLPELTAKNTEKKAYGRVKLIESSKLLDTVKSISKPVHTAAPKFMEDIGQSYGYTLYSTTVTGPLEELELGFETMHDRAVVYINGEKKGWYERARHEDKITLSLEKDETVSLDILCENMGRVNYGVNLRDRKGLTGIRFGQRFHYGWDMYPLEMQELGGVEYKPYENGCDDPVFLRGEFEIKGKPCDTFIMPSQQRHGIVIINGFNLGRYYNAAGPQKTLFVPAPVLREGKNEIVIFDMDGCDGNEVEFLDEPVLG